MLKNIPKPTAIVKLQKKKIQKNQEKKHQKGILSIKNGFCNCVYIYKSEKLVKGRKSPKQVEEKVWGGEEYWHHARLIMLKDHANVTCYGGHACLLRQGLGATGQRAKCSKSSNSPDI